MSGGLKILMDWDTVDAVIETYLLDSHFSLTQQIKIIKSKKKPKDFELEDLETFERALEGVEKMGEWCVFDFNKKAKKYAKQQLR
jgi:hypothetical protein